MAKDVFPELVHEQNEDILELKKLPNLKSVEIVGCKELKGTPVRDAVSNYFPCFILLYVFRHHPTCTGDQQELKAVMESQGQKVKVQVKQEVAPRPTPPGPKPK